jgi:hypothetical protein
MDNLAEGYMEEFSQKLQDFPVFFNKWWFFKSILNNSFADVKTEDIAYWLFMQSFAQKQINQVAEKLPEKGKEVIDSMKKAVEQVETSQ